MAASSWPSHGSRIVWKSPVVGIFAAILLVALILRVVTAILFPNMEVSDETFATREAAHRLAYGYGLINPDWRQGIRSWVFPAFLAVVMRATGWIGVGSAGYLLGIVVVLSLISLTTVWFSFLWAYRVSGIVAAVIAAGASASWYELLYYGPKALYEVVAAHVLLPGLYVGVFGDSIPERTRMFLAGLFCGLAFCLRPPLGPAILFVAAALILRNPRTRFAAMAAGIMTPVILFGIVDAFTWSYPFHSFVAFFWVNTVQFHSDYAKLGSWAIQHEWIRPWWWFLPVLAERLGPMSLVALVGVRRSPFLGLVALVILLTHSAAPHKEFRFIYPIIPLAITLAGLGVAELSATVSSGIRWVRSGTTAACILGLAFCLCISGAIAKFFPLWSRYSGNLLALEQLSRDASVCGVALVGPQVDPGITGGYTYLHRNVPVFFFRAAAGGDMKRLTPSFDAVVTSLPLHENGFELTRCWSGTCLYRRQGSCKPDPADEVKFLPVE